MSADNTSRWLYPLFHFLTGVDAARFDVWNGYLRKCGHFVGYGTLSVLLFFAWRATLNAIEETVWTWRWAAVSLLMSALVASLDEWHQSYLPSRTGTYRDVILDSVAALTAQIVVMLWLTKRRHSPSTPVASGNVEAGS